MTIKALSVDSSNAIFSRPYRVRIQFSASGVSAANSTQSGAFTGVMSLHIRMTLYREIPVPFSGNDTRKSGA